MVSHELHMIIYASKKVCDPGNGMGLSRGGPEVAYEQKKALFRRVKRNLGTNPVTYEEEVVCTFCGVKWTKGRRSILVSALQYTPTPTVVPAREFSSIDSVISYTTHFSI